jgi:thiol-disulfide isomerase/thioredoxin
LPLVALLVVVTLAFAQTPPAPPPAPLPAPDLPPAPPAPPTSPVAGIRNKVSAGDLRSAESILEVYVARNGEDGNALVGLSWLARGALLLGEPARADRYAADVRARCADSIAHGAGPARNHDVEIALGAALEVEAQRLAATRGAAAAAAHLRAELSRLPGPVALRSRLQKRLNMLSLPGQPAPEIAVEDFVGAPPPALASLRGSPVLLFLWAEGCGDCKAQAAALARVASRHAAQGLRVLTITRYYDGADVRAAEKARVDSVWKAVYAGVGEVPIVISTAAMERYGCSSTPTFVFVDRRGIVRGYTPTRLTEAELERAVAPILR